MRSFLSLRGRREFTTAIRRGACASTSALSVYAYAPRSADATRPKVGVIVNKKVGGAVVRNRLRRRCKAVLHEALQSATGRWLVVQCKSPSAALPYAELQRQLTEAVARAMQRPKPATPRRKAP